MSKVKLLLDVISDVRSLADSLQAVANAIAENEPATVEATPTQEPVKEEKQPTKKNTAKKEYTLEDVRGILATKSQNGLTAEVKGLIEKYGGTKLSDIDPTHYADIMKDAEVLGNE
ncbi:hypothetical protein TPDSL_03230 [Terrisporobacter petrolearius]|jgi:hypothetical protein|uniref:rRNA biogenesis protein rrp5 n=1 Tax=Terrisporobacter petrolearius TaxID=1460447 RepID=UPI0033685275